MIKRRLLQLNRLRVLRRGQAVYDQTFHEGVNIIRGQNGSGKSTIADFIFFILGGEFDDWKDSASRCDEVQAEITTSEGILTLRRTMESRTSPVNIYFGEIETAKDFALEGWQRFPIRRQGGNESFSQILFRSLNIPEAKSDGAANITMHQLLRLCYSDQRTPATRLFRFEPFDTQNIREAVGDLICGISGYEVYEANILYRELDKELSFINTRLSSLLKALPPDAALRTTMSIHQTITDLSTEREQLNKDIKRVDQNIEGEEAKGFLRERSVAQNIISKERGSLYKLETEINNIEFESKEIEDFQSYLIELTEKLHLSEASFNAIGLIEFMHCPACGKEINKHKVIDHCAVCKSPIDSEIEKSRYNQIRLDLEIQTRESKQLYRHNKSDLDTKKKHYRVLRTAHEKSLSEFEMKYSGANGPREAYLAEKTSRIGHINAEVEFLTNSLGVASEIDTLNEKKNYLELDITKLKQRRDALQKKAYKRRNRALGEISDIAVSLLHADFKRQEEFEAAQKVELNFLNDAMSVDDHVNFAESSNVFLKNSVIFSLFLAAGSDEEFFHPRFLLLDNIEDKGMEMERSHLFQRLIVERATELKEPFQVIFTTSMMNPELELDDYVIGPHYTKEEKTLNFSSKITKTTRSEN